nr:immunoglobulin heavy chain junction region [Macaca mulatta]MOW32757.1 immunoglobulin heavy chain junction region [Macaca mulatta]MOW33619.1 immunoglobulin heavy chain junction region [Macaca mulatta]MOW33671.1 immunoglobulin heavy chain junction region [Macaca mulatta]
CLPLGVVSAINDYGSDYVGTW